MTVFSLKLARIHEAYGPASHSFAVMAAAQRAGQVLWLREAWQKVEVFPMTMSPFIAPERVVLITPKNPTDLLAVAEEALKEPLFSCVVLEISSPLNLREGRRLQLGAKAGGGLGICLLPNAEMGSNAAETRWYCRPLYDPTDADSTLMHWQIIKNKSGTIGSWHVSWNEAAHHIDMAAAPSIGTGVARED